MNLEEVETVNADPSKPDQAKKFSDLLPLKQTNARIAAVQNLVQSYRQTAMPQWISFSATAFCNLRCPQCQTHGTEEMHTQSNARVWPDDFLQKLAKETLPYAFEFNLGLNGEPLATPFIRQRLREFRRYGARLHLTTNGTLLSKQTIARVLPLASTIAISLDGATERTCEAIRLGSSFKDLIYKIKVLARACELLPGHLVKPDLRLAFTVMASNVRDLPELVRLAHFLRVPAVDVYDLVVFFPHVVSEDLKLHKPLYNAYHERAMKEARKLKVGLYMPEPFRGAGANADARIEGPGLIVGQLPDDYYDSLPTLESLVDLEAVESEAVEIVKLIAAEQNPEGESPVETALIEAAQARLDSSLSDLFSRYGPELGSPPEEEVSFCENLFNRTFVNWAGEVTPCCVPGRPVLGNAHENTIEEIYNGESYNKFREEFFSSKPPDCCVGCRSFMRVPKQRLLDEIKRE